VVVTCRREKDGGKWSHSEDARIILLRTAIAEGVEYVDLEEDIASQIPRFGKTKRIISMHDFQETPENLEEIAARLAALDADVVKLATMANTPHDNVRMLEVTRNSKIPLIGMCMGEIGMPSRILAGKFGAPFTYATFHHERTLAPGQLSYRQMTEIYRYNEINADTKVYGVVADPIGHSLSPVIHNASFRELELNNTYIPFRVPSEDLDQFLSECPALGVKGLSVTIPHKEFVVPRLNKVDGAVRGIAAANTIVFQGDDLIGYNTDYRAAMDSLDAALGAAPSTAPLSGKTALVLGAGGVAKAIAFGLRRRNADVVIAGNIPEQAQELADRLDCRTVAWEARHSVQADVLVNCTPVGMHPNVDETPFDGPHIGPSTIVFDCVYNPEQTLLIKQARQKGCRVITGVEMFVRQAALQFKYFTGNEAPVKLMHTMLKQFTGAVRP